MLVLSRNSQQEVVILLPDGRRITILVIEAHGNRARLGFECDREIQIFRAELLERNHGDHF